MLIRALDRPLECFRRAFRPVLSIFTYCRLISKKEYSLTSECVSSSRPTRSLGEFCDFNEPRYAEPDGDRVAAFGAVSKSTIMNLLWNGEGKNTALHTFVPVPRERGGSRVEFVSVFAGEARCDF